MFHEPHSLWICLKEPQVLIALHKSCWMISSHQLCMEAMVPQHKQAIEEKQPERYFHSGVLLQKSSTWWDTLNLEGTSYLAADLRWPVRWRMHLLTSQCKLVQTLKAALSLSPSRDRKEWFKLQTALPIILSVRNWICCLCSCSGKGQGKWHGHASKHAHALRNFCKGGGAEETRRKEKH